jgi:hypothetical protein
VQIKEMDPCTLSLVLDYVYSGEVELSVSNVQNVLSAANMFQMIALRDGCAAFMMRHITCTNCVGIYFFAKAHECYRLAARARILINSEFQAVCHEPEFRALPADQLIELISDDQVQSIIVCKLYALMILFWTRWFLCLVLFGLIFLAEPEDYLLVLYHILDLLVMG